MNNDLMFSSKSNEWATPQKLYNKLNSEFHFTLDAASTHENAKCERHFTIEEDGLMQDWSNEVVWLNPPYGRKIDEWIFKGWNEALWNNATVVCLIPARTDTKYWHDYCMDASEIRFIKGRLKFGDSKNAAPSLVP
jgi:site-specific DNA-methyltransferase (adenine-specific)